ncbi:MAG: hypothetical protein IKR74_03140 [Bacilli bacterium]|nr:hypothetical protein [Bacilli bacterium]
MNKISFDELKNITNVIGSNNIDSVTLFDYFRIAHNTSVLESSFSNPLFFVLYLTHEEALDAWYINDIDMRSNLLELMCNYPNYTFIVDKTMKSKLKNCDYKYIMVEDVNQTIDDLFNYFKSKSHAKTIAVTGSVGKTTCVGLIESILKQKYNVFRIYSKRITPLVLKSTIINNLNDEIDYIVLENSIYYHDHVKILAGLLNPEISAILNIESSHLGIEKLKTIDDICFYKSYIMQCSKKCFLIKGDPYLDKLHLDSDILKYDDKTILNNSNLQLERIDLDKITIENDCFNIDNQIVIEPFMLSSLSKKQYAVAYEIGKELGLTNVEIKKGMEEYIPVENRVQKEIAFGKTILFDGDVTTYERIKELSDNMYQNKYLVLRKVGSAENTLRIANIKDFFDRYKKVYIFGDVEYLEELKDGDNVVVVNNHDFMQDLKGTIIYHYSGYFRVWDNYDENNLNIYDKEKYPIIKEEK